MLIIVVCIFCLSLALFNSVGALVYDATAVEKAKAYSFANSFANFW